MRNIVRFDDESTGEFLTRTKKRGKPAWRKYLEVGALVATFVSGVVMAGAYHWVNWPWPDKAEVTEIRRDLSSMHAEFDFMVERLMPGAVKDFHDKSAKGREE